MSDWIRVMNTTIANYIAGAENNVVRNRKLLSLLKSRGRITFNWSGEKMVWRIRYARGPLQGYADAETLTFPRRNRWKTAEIDWRGYAATEGVTKLERLKNRGPQQIIDLFADTTTAMLEDIEENFGDELYIDGNQAGNTKRIHGIESFMGSSGTSLPYVASPSDTFAGLSTALGAYGGRWTGNWPSGKGDAQYDFFSPTLVDYTDTNWQADTYSWATVASQALRYGIIRSQRNKTQKGRLDIAFLESEMYRLWIESLTQTERIIVEKNTSNSPMAKLGWGDVQNFDGVDITWEFGTPDAIGYGMNVDQMELRSMQDRLFVSEGPTYDESTASYKMKLDFFGNCVWNPRYFTKWKNYT